MRNLLSLALKLDGTGASREADWLDLIAADTFGAIFLLSALRTSGLRAVAGSGALARAFVRIGRAGPPGCCAGRGPSAIWPIARGVRWN